MKRYLVTITDNIAPTSMPYNEFVLYRRDHESEEKQIIILLFKTNTSELVPTNLELHCIGKDSAKLKRVIEDVVIRAKADNAKVVFHIHEAKSVLLFNIATWYRYKKRIVYTLHSTYKNYPFHNKLFALLASRQCGQVVCVSKTSYKYYPEIFKKRACYIQNGVDIERIDKAIKDVVKEENKKFTLIYVARLIELKRHKLLFNAVRRIPGVRLKLIGYGPLEEELRREAEGLEVEFLGAKTRDQVYNELSKADAYVSSSSYEGLPISVLEAMRCGLPCILSDIEQHWEIAQKSKELILCSDDRWGETIKKLMDLGKTELVRIGASNAEDAEKYFSLCVMHRDYENIYLKVEED